jgi:hypothetical protein
MDRAEELLGFIRSLERKNDRSEVETDDLKSWRTERLALLNRPGSKEEIIHYMSVYAYPY